MGWISAPVTIPGGVLLSLLAMSAGFWATGSVACRLIDFVDERSLGEEAFRRVGLARLAFEAWWAATMVALLLTLAVSAAADGLDFLGRLEMRRGG